MPGVLNILAASISSAISDGYFNRVTLLLSGNGTNGAQNNTFLDSSSNNFSITRNGNTTQGNFSPFSQTGWGNYLNGSSDYLSASQSAFVATGDFTVEAWVYVTQTGAYQGIVSTRDGTDTAGFGLGITNTNNLEFWLNTTSNAGTAFVFNQWNHVAMVRSGTGTNNVSCYFNGTRVAQFTNTSSTTNSALAIGRYRAAGTNQYWLGGYISNARLVVGSAIYSGATITVPTSPLTAVSNTQLLTCQSNRFVDNSSNAFAITTNGTPSVQSFSPFAPTAAYSASAVGGSGYFDGSGDYLSIADNTAFNLSSGSWTIEAWAYPTSSAASYKTVICKRASSSAEWEIGLDTSNQFYFYSSSTLQTSTTVVPINSWAHLAASYDGTNLRLFVNGALVKTAAQTAVSGTAPVTIGKEGTASSVQNWFGYITSCRVVKGTAVYTSAFTPPTAPLTAITNTSLLLNYTNGGIVDATSKNDLETVGNAQISTAQSKFGGSSMYFDGNGDFLQGQNTNYLFGSGNFTVEGWIYPSGTTGLQYIASVWGISGQSDATYSSWVLRLNAANLEVVLQPTGGGGLTTITGTGSGITANTWQYVAVVRNGSTVTLYINGSSVGSGTFSATLNSPVSVFAIGAQLSNNNTFNGYIDDLRITRYARTISASPTAAFPVQ